MALDHPKRHLITAALPYANGPIHIGHLAGAFLPADVYVRYLKLKKEEVLFVCGSDEHGAAITLRAKKEGKSPQEIVDNYHNLNKKAFSDFGIDFDIFHRTSSKLHHETAQEFFKTLSDKGVFTEKSNEQYYDEKYKQFLADRYISGDCPKCNHEGAYGDQCENCGSALNPKELINPVSTLSNKPPVLKETKHWFLPMNEDEEWLKKWINEGELNGTKLHDPKTWRKQVIGQCKSWLDGGLQERAMTRDLDWGVKVPLKNAEGKVLYVWLDAPIGYISATKQWASENGANWEDYWKSEDTEMLHFIGKDNIVFHCLIFPILLKRHEGFNLPKNVPANEFLNLEGDKISTSRDWAVWLHEFMEQLPGKNDVLRYVLNSIAPESKDSEFTWDDFQARNNSELVAIYGNFVNRAVVLCHKYYDGIVPEQGDASKYQSVIDQLHDAVAEIDNCMQQLRIRDAQTACMKLARIGNKFLADTEPWKLIKTDPEEVKTILNLSLQIAANSGIAFSPFLPQSSENLAEMIGLKQFSWENLGSLDLIKSGEQLNAAKHLFEKIEDDLIEFQKERLKKISKMKEEEEELAFKKDISFEDFQKLDIRVGKILSAKKLEKSKKLIQFSVDLGKETRTILSGIAEHFEAEELIGKSVQVLCNLPPRKMMGIASEGMILSAEDQEGKLFLLEAVETCPPGSKVG